MEGRSRQSLRVRGFTIVELMVTIVIAAILVAMAAPVYKETREKAIVRGAVGDLFALTTQARFEAAKRNDYVTMSVRGSGSNWCIGLQAGVTGCDCLTATCDIAKVDKTNLNGARLAAAADFGGGSTDVSIDPRMGMTKDLASSGSLIVRSPSDSWDFQVQYTLSTTAKPSLCVPNSSAHKLTDYPSC